MDEFHARLIRIGLATAERYGFCLAVGYAVQAHGFVQRRSEDVDLFTSMNAVADSFSEAVDSVAQALRDDGLQVTVPLRFDTFARLAVGDPVSGASSKMELGVDYRAHPPARMEIGPVLHADDAVANKLCALFGRAAVRDYVDVDGIIGSGRYDISQLVALAKDHDPGFDAAMFADALRAVQRMGDRPFAQYGMSPEAAQALRDRLVAAADSFDPARQPASQAPTQHLTSEHEREPRAAGTRDRGYDR